MVFLEWSIIYYCHLLNSFGSALSLSEHLWHFRKRSESRRKSSEVAGLPFTTRWKTHAFDSKRLAINCTDSLSTTEIKSAYWMTFKSKLHMSTQGNSFCTARGSLRKRAASNGLQLMNRDWNFVKLVPTKMQAGKTTTFFYLTIERIFSVEWKVSLSPALADSPAMFQSEPWIQAADQRCVI